jgi:hypothetical protein
MRDLHDNINPTKPDVVTVTDTTAVVSGIVDTQGFDALEFVIAAGTLADVDATFTVLVEDGAASNLSDAAAVADAYLLGTEALAGFTFAEDQKTRKVGYIGPKRYVRCTVTPVANTGSAPIAIVPILGRPSHAPTANPPA